MSELNGICVMITRPTAQLKTRLWGAVCLIGLMAIAGCTNVPMLDATIPDHLRDADYPKLVRLDGIIATTMNPREQADEIEKSLEARRNRLQSQARRVQELPD
ncbi:MAG: hypothetical protein L3J36_03175 [Rhodobacteraceae bacterium]|nr:hypothetical protein [Paracoccaceae bacterium]